MSSPLLIAMLSKPSTTTSLDVVGRREHYATRMKREIKQERATNKLLLEFLEKQGMMAQYETFSSSGSASSVNQGCQGGDDLPDGGDFFGSGDEGSSGGSDDPDDDDDDDGNFFDQREDFTVYVRLNAIGIFMTKSITVKPSWQLKILKCILYNNYKIKSSWIRFDSSSGRTLFEHLSFTANGLKNYDTVIIQMTGCGGGKRGSDGGARGNNKKNKQEKILDITDSIDTMKLKLQSNPLTQLATTGVDLIDVAKTSAERAPEMATTNALQHFDIQQLKRLQVALTSGNSEHKLQSFSKELFFQVVSNIDQIKRQFATLQHSMTDVGHLICLQQFGAEDGSIGWSALATLVGDVLEKKSKEVGRQSTATPPPPPPPTA